MFSFPRMTKACGGIIPVIASPLRGSLLVRVPIL